jgi:hypothetical protein
MMNLPFGRKMGGRKKGSKYRGLLAPLRLGNNARYCSQPGALLGRAGLSAQIQGAVNYADVTEGLRKIAQHTASERVEFFSKQPDVIAVSKQAIE